MNQLRTNIYTQTRDLPEGLSQQDYFHSPQLFMLCKQTPRHKPYMVVVETPDGEIIAQMLAMVRYRSSFIPPYLYMHCRVLGEGVYHSVEAYDMSQSDIFAMMIGKLTEKLGRRMLYIEVSNLSQKMFAYKELRSAGYFPVRWMSIHNSLHSHTPEERISERMQKRLNTAYARGVVTDEVVTDSDFEDFMRLLRHHNWLKPKRFIPHKDFFLGIVREHKGQLYLTRFRGHAIGCSAVVYSGRHEDLQNNAYLWFAAFRRKSFAWLHPADVTIWHAIKESHRLGYDHICFLDVGLPFRKNHFRDLILRFGGKPTSTYRWFRSSISWLNRLFSWFYHD
ncbi:MAG: GNAT family N-acetyltransferase [Prevotella sp.]|jgi:hypothetical protein